MFMIKFKKNTHHAVKSGLVLIIWIFSYPDSLSIILTCSLFSWILIKDTFEICKNFSHSTRQIHWTILMLLHLMQLQKMIELLSHTHCSSLINKLSNIHILGCKTLVLWNVFVNFFNKFWQWCMMIWECTLTYSCIILIK